MTAPTLPALILTTDGRMVDADTGAIVQTDDPTALPATITDALNGYARARVEADALALRINERRAWLIRDLVQTALDADQDHQADIARHDAARQTIAETEAALDGFFADRADKVSLDTGRVLVTWGKPRETWSLANPPSWYAGDKAVPSLARYLVSRNACDLLAAEQIAEVVLEWLDPAAKAGAAPAVKLTVRS